MWARAHRPQHEGVILGPRRLRIRACLQACRIRSSTNEGFSPCKAAAETVPSNPSSQHRCSDALIRTSYRATTFSISAFSWSYGSAPGWYIATFPVRSSSTSVGVVEAP